MPAPLKIAVLGAGSMGTNHVRVAAQHSRVDLVGVIDPDLSRARALADAAGVAAATSVEELGALDAAVVAVPTEHHVEVALPLLARGLPLLVEKPLAPDLAGVQALLDAARAGGVPLMCGFVERFNPAVATAVEGLDEPPIHVLALRHSPTTPRLTTSVVHDLLIHDIDLALRLWPSPEVDPQVTSLSWATAAGVVELADCTVVLGGAGGVPPAVATLSASRVSQRKVRSLSVATANTLVEVDLLRHDVTVYRHRSQTLIEQGGPTYRAETVVDIPFVRHRGEPLALQLDHFVDLVGGQVDADSEMDSLLAPHRVAAAVAAGPCLGGRPAMSAPSSPGP